MAKIACIIPTYNGREQLLRLLKTLQAQTALFDVFVVDSSSYDDTVDIAKQYAVDVVTIPANAFNHGGTRQLLVDKNPDYEIYIFLTQDSCLADMYAIERIIDPLNDPQIGAVCGRQLPHVDANALARHARAFNYPDGRSIKGMDDVPNLGLRTAFISNSFAAYRAVALRQAGGFPSHVIFGEDMYVAAKMLMDGWKVAYAGDAQCRHSHNYTVTEEFRRYFDIGVLHARESWIRLNFGGAGGEGMRYVKSELKFLGLQRIYLWPSSLLRNALKLVAYMLGQNERHLPIRIKRKIGLYRRYWDGPFANWPGT